MVSLTRTTLRIAEMVRATVPGAFLVAGGPLPTVFPGRYTGHVDAVLRGEADLSFARFCRDYVEQGASRATFADGLPLPTYPGLHVQRPGLTIDNPTVHHSESELAGFPLPDRSQFDHAFYQAEWQRTAGTKTTLQSLPPWGARTAATFAQNRSSAPLFVAASWAPSSPRSTRSRPSATTTSGSPTTSSR